MNQIMKSKINPSLSFNGDRNRVLHNRGWHTLRVRSCDRCNVHHRDDQRNRDENSHGVVGRRQHGEVERDILAGGKLLDVLDAPSLADLGASSAGLDASLVAAWASNRDGLVALALLLEGIRNQLAAFF